MLAGVEDDHLRRHLFVFAHQGAKRHLRLAEPLSQRIGRFARNGRLADDRLVGHLWRQREGDVGRFHRDQALDAHHVREMLEGVDGLGLPGQSGRRQDVGFSCRLKADDDHILVAAKIEVELFRVFDDLVLIVEDGIGIEVKAEIACGESRGRRQGQQDSHDEKWTPDHEIRQPRGNRAETAKHFHDCSLSETSRYEVSPVCLLAKSGPETVFRPASKATRSPRSVHPC